MKKSNQMRINDNELNAMYIAVRSKVTSFISNYTDDGEPVFLHTEENEIMIALFFKLFKEMQKRGLYNA